MTAYTIFLNIHKLDFFLNPIISIINIIIRQPNNQEHSISVVYLLVWWWMKGRVAFPPSVTFDLHGVLLPVGPRHVSAQRADWQGLWGTDKMWVEIRLPFCSLPQTHRSPLHSLTEEERNNNLDTHTHTAPAALRCPAAKEFVSPFSSFLPLFFLLLCFFLPCYSLFEMLGANFPTTYHSHFRTTIIFGWP